MCGIVVGLTFGNKTKKEETIRQNVLQVLTTELLIETEDRGKDAVGAVTLFNDGNFYGIKRGEQVSKFIHKFAKTKEYYGGFLKVWKEHDAPVRVYLGHCRAATHGNKLDNVNNHPIQIGNIVGIHNGTLKNHEEIFKHLKCKRDGEVDSEAIFRLFEYFTKKGTEPFTTDMIQEVVRRLTGSFAVVLFNADNLTQIPVFRDARPIEFVLIKNLGILLMVSEIKFWNAVWPRYERLVHYYQNDDMLPTLTHDGNVITQKMEDDTAIIFNLDREVTKETTIKDLGDTRKMKRTNKIWTTTSTGYMYGNVGFVGYRSSGGCKTNNNYSTNTATDKTKNEGTTKSVGNNEKKMRVFDNIRKRYVTKIGDIVLDNNTGAIIDIDSDKNLGYELDSIEEIKDNPVKIDDRTKYEEDDGKKEIIDTNDGAVYVETDKIPVEVRELAELAYRDLPSQEKGFSDIDELLDTIEVKNSYTLNHLGHTIVANRVYKHAWKQGFMAAIMRDLDNQIVEKSEKRTKYIEQLKELVVAITTDGEHKTVDEIIKNLQHVFNKNELDNVKKHVEVKK